MLFEVPNKKVILTVLSFLSWVCSTLISNVYSKNEAYKIRENLFVEKISNCKYFSQEILSSEKQQRSTLINQYKKLRIQNHSLARERDFYFKKAKFYENILKKREMNNFKFSDNQVYANFKNFRFSPGRNNISLNSSFISKNAVKFQERERSNIKEEYEKKLKVDNYIRYLEDKLDEANNKIQILQSKIPPDNIHLNTGNFIEKEQKNSIKPLQIPYTDGANNIADIHLKNLKLKHEIKKLKDSLKFKNDEEYELIKEKSININYLLKKNEENLIALSEINETRNKENEKNLIALSEINEARNKENEKNLIALSETNEARNKEIEENRSRILLLVRELNNFRNDKTLEEYKRKIQFLEIEIAKLLGMNVQSSPEQTQVWIPLDLDIFFYIDQLKLQPKVSDQPLKHSMRLLKEEYDLIKGSLKGLSKMIMKPLSELDAEEITTFEIVKNNAVKIQNVKLPTVEKCKKLLENSMRVYEEFLEQKNQETPGLIEYVDIQNIYHLISRKISFDDFMNTMEKFNLCKNILIEIARGEIKKLGFEKSSSYLQILKLLELEQKDITLTNFIKKYTTPPSTFSKDISSSPFILINQRTSMAKSFNNLKLNTTTHHKTGSVKPGLEEKDPFKIFRQKIKEKANKYSNINEDLIDFSEKMYMLKYLNKHWNHLQDTVFNQDLEQTIQNCNLKNSDSKFLLEPDVKDILCTIIQKDFLQEPSMIIHDSYVRELNKKLSSSLSYRNIESWQKSPRLSLREDLIDIYTTYKSIVSLGFTRNNKNPKIKEFHEE